MKTTALLVLIIATVNFNLFSQSEGEYDAKVALLTDSIAAHPDNVNFYFNRGEANMQNGDAESAMADFQNVVDLYNSNPVGKEADIIASAYYKLSEYQFNTKKNSPAALTLIVDGLKLKPQDKFYLLHEARVLASMPDKKDEAIAKFDNLVAAYPTDEKILTEYGAFIKKWEPAKAILLFEKVLRVNVLSVDALQELGDLYSTLAKQVTDKDKAAAYRDKAISYLKHLYNLRPENSSVKNHLIELLNLRGRTGEANELQK